MPPSTGPISSTASQEEAELCLEPADYYGLRSRLTIGQVMRSFLDAQTLTPSELLYGARATKLLQNFSGQVETALGKVAAIQARVPGQDLRVRRAAMQKMLAEIQGRIAKADATIPRLTKSIPAFPALLATGLRPGVSPENDSLLMAGLCRDLGDLRSWSAKLSLILELLRSDPEQLADSLLDEVLADLISVPSVAGDLMGPALSLGGSMRRIIDLALTELPRPIDSAPSPLIQINDLILSGRLPTTRTALLERVRRVLRSPQPLGTGRRDEEIRYFHDLLIALCSPVGVVGEGAMAEALLARYMRRLDQGGALGGRLAMEGILATLPRLANRWQFLAALAGSETGVRQMGDVIAQVAAVTANDDHLDSVLLKGRETKQLRAAMDAAVASFERSGLPREAKDRIGAIIRGTFDGYVLRGQFFETLSRTEGTINRRLHLVYDLVNAGLHNDETTRTRLLEYCSKIVEAVPEPAPPVFTRAVTPARGTVASAPPVAPAAAPPPARRSGAPPAPSPPVPSLPAPVGDPGATVMVAPLAPAFPLVPPPIMGAYDPASLAVTQMGPAVTEFGGGATVLGNQPTQMGPANFASSPIQGATEFFPMNGATQVMLDGVTQMGPMTAPSKPAERSPSRATVGGMRCPSCFETKQGAVICPACGFDETAGPRPGVQLQPGVVLSNRYSIGKVLGQGGFGITYLSWDTRLQVLVAVKEYLPVSLVTRTPGTRPVVAHSPEHELAFREGMARFMDEARILARLRNVPEIVEVHDFYEEQGTAYMVMELLEGRTLQRCLQEDGGTLDYRRALSLMLPVIKAVHHVHEQGLIHRDLSPDNIFINKTGGAKLLDFGAARQAIGENTGNLTVILKRGYAPPEQYSSDTRQGPWTDVYAMCATFYCAIVGRPPPAAIGRWDNDPLQRPSALGIPVPAAVEDVLLSGLTLRWQDRPRDMRVLLQAFTNALRG